MQSAPCAIIVMGVSASGKSTIGERLARLLGARFIEGDGFHSPESIAKMAGGSPLRDEDRWPWLDRIRASILECLKADQSVVVTCSALRRAYRDRLRQGLGGRLRFVFLDGPQELLEQRITHRPHHFMSPALLESQLATLERPAGEDDVVTVRIAQSVDAIIAEAAGALKLVRPRAG